MPVTLRRAFRVGPVAMALPPPIRLIASRRKPSVRVYITEKALEDVWSAVAAGDVRIEHGGALAGRYGVDAAETRFVVISTIVPATSAPGTATHISIRAEDWIEIYRRLDQRADLSLIGWFHSHPGLGVAMSWTDRCTQRFVCNADWQVGLVVDPFSRRFRFYQGPAAKRAPWVGIAP